MTVEVAKNEPVEARAGTTWAWRREDLSDFPATTWQLKYWFKKTGSSGANFSVTAAADGAAHAVTVAASTTQGYTAGTYTWAAQVTAGIETYEVDRGLLKLLPRYDVASNVDDRSHARKALEAIEAVIENRATLDQMEYTIGTRSLKRMSPEQLRDWRDYYRGQAGAEEMAERIRNGQGGNRLTFRLGR